jgi:hypothetical protein
MFFLTGEGLGVARNATITLVNYFGELQQASIHTPETTRVGPIV